MVADEDGVAISEGLKIDVVAVAVSAAVVAVVVTVVDVVEGGGDAVRRDAPPVRHFDYAIFPASRERNLSRNFLQSSLYISLCCLSSPSPRSC